MIVVTACFSQETCGYRPSAGAPIVRTPMGARAPIALDRFLARKAAPALLIASGFCGGLDARFSTGDLILADAVRCQGDEILIDKGLITKASAALAGDAMPATIGALITAEGVAGPDEKGRLAATGAVGVDMESGPLAAWALRHGVGFLALRAVVDPMDMEVPFGRRRSIWVSALLHPRAVFDLWRRSRITGRVLGRALTTLVTALGGDEA